MKVLLVSPYDGGSHAAWARGLRDASRHAVELLTLPDRFWKWRMHGGAVTLARRFLQRHGTRAGGTVADDRGCERLPASPRSGGAPRLIVATDMLDLTTFLALTRELTADTPAVLYMHENQLTYPLPEDPAEGPMRRQKGERDHHYAFVNYASMLAADHIAFNSRFHLEAWFDELPRFLRHFPEHNEIASVATLRRKSSVLPVGLVGSDAPAAPRASAGATSSERAAGYGPPLVLWNQRWEYDKNPTQLVRALRDVADRDIPFRLALCGQSFGDSPAALVQARQLFAEQLVHFGFAEPDDYRELLRRAEVTVSTATHEFFGVAVLEAMLAGAFAVLPDRLSYPELLDGPAVSDATRNRCLYRSHAELVETLAWSLRQRPRAAAMAAELRANAQRFCWSRLAPEYDRLIDDVARRRG